MTLAVPGAEAKNFVLGKPDPFDYNFCGGERVYPVVGVHLSTACGPRNMVALGRRGKIMWHFPPSKDGSVPERQGARQLTPAELDRLSLLAEVAQVADAPQQKPGRIQYKMGIDFSGREPRRMHTTLADDYVPGQALLEAILQLIPDKPQLPACGNSIVMFDPSLTRLEREEQVR